MHFWVFLIVYHKAGPNFVSFTLIERHWCHVVNKRRQYLFYFRKWVGAFRHKRSSSSNDKFECFKIPQETMRYSFRMWHLENYLQIIQLYEKNVTYIRTDTVIIGSRNRLVPSDNKPLSKSIWPFLWCIYASLSLEWLNWFNCFVSY